MVGGWSDRTSRAQMRTAQQASKKHGERKERLESAELRAWHRYPFLADIPV